jgi:hypothetical protein
MCFIEISELPGNVDFIMIEYNDETIIVVSKGIGALQKTLVGEFVTNKANTEEKVS